ncbi:EamA family transporter [Devriesea agamarum]|uniref:EamA family transporter n=1 Tax=Devriesea agamarum TaxID=472569 RepID=UPI00071DE711|nr:EamA family transporter [Devriesea agamarum]
MSSRPSHSAETTPVGPAPSSSHGPQYRPGAGVALLTTGAASTQIGAACAAMVIAPLGIPAVVAIRQLVMSLMHVPLAWRYLRRARSRDLAWGVLVALPLAGMNTAIYAAIAEIGVGLAVTLEFLGPLILAVIATRNLIGVLCAGAGFAGMILVTGPQGSATPAGAFFALLAALCWALYLAAARSAGRRLEGLAPSAIAAVCTTALFGPIALATMDFGAVTVPIMALALLAGLLSSAIPYAADVLALRRLPLGIASTLMSLHPACAALAGAIILGEKLTPADLTGLALISVANVVAVAAGMRGTGSPARGRSLLLKRSRKPSKDEPSNN